MAAAARRGPHPTPPNFDHVHRSGHGLVGPVPDLFHIDGGFLCAVSVGLVGKGRLTLDGQVTAVRYDSGTRPGEGAPGVASVSC